MRLGIMAESFPDNDDPHDPIDRAARYWKRAAEMYSLACSAQTDEVKKLYIGVAMSWATMAHELEHSPSKPVHHGYPSWSRH
jgi:hypothetical protein